MLATAWTVRPDHLTDSVDGSRGSGQDFPTPHGLGESRSARSKIQAVWAIDDRAGCTQRRSELIPGETPEQVGQVEAFDFIEYPKILSQKSTLILEQLVWREAPAILNDR